MGSTLLAGQRPGLLQWMALRRWTRMGCSSLPLIPSRLHAAACSQRRPPQLAPSVYKGSCRSVVHTNDDKAGRELLMLPKCVLCAPPRFSPRHQKAVGACILDRLHRWQEGERLGLWDSRPSRQTANGQHPSAEQRRALATSLAREGFDRKACAGVVSNGLCAPTAETMAALSGPGPGMTGSTVPPKKLPLSWTSAMRSTLFVVKPCCPP